MKKNNDNKNPMEDKVRKNGEESQDSVKNVEDDACEREENAATLEQIPITSVQENPEEMLMKAVLLMNAEKYQEAAEIAHKYANQYPEAFMILVLLLWMGEGDTKDFTKSERLNILQQLYVKVPDGTKLLEHMKQKLSTKLILDWYNIVSQLEKNVSVVLAREGDGGALVRIMAKFQNIKFISIFEDRGQTIRFYLWEMQLQRVGEFAVKNKLPNGQLINGGDNVNSMLTWECQKKDFDRSFDAVLKYVDVINKEYEENLDLWNIFREEKEFHDDTIDAFVSRFDVLNIDKESKRELIKFLSYQFQYGRKNSSVQYNLMLVCEDKRLAMKFCFILWELMYCLDATDGHKQIDFVSKIEDLEDDELEKIMETPNKYQSPLTVITDIHEASDFSVPNPMFLEHENERLHGILLKFSKAHKNSIKILVCSRSVAKERLKPNSEIYYREFGHRIYINNYTADNCRKMVLQRLTKKHKFEISKEFDEEFKKYMESIYEDADLKNEEFVVDMERRILSNFYATYRDNKVLGADVIPSYYVPKTVDEVHSGLDDMIGMETVKNEIVKLTSLVLDKNFDKNKHKHLIFAGSPGTGKSVTAEVVKDILYATGVIEKNILVSRNAADMIGDHVGQTAPKIEALAKEADGGVLFIDEAYGLAGSEDGQDSYRKEAIEKLLTVMTEYNVTCILAGYKTEMEKFLKQNAGLSSRIYKTIEFPDFTEDELIQLFVRHCTREEFELTEDAKEALKDRVRFEMCQEHFGNARTIDQLFDRVKSAYFDDVRRNGEKDRVITEQHMKADMPERQEIDIRELIGLESVKSKLEQFEQRVKYYKFCEQRGMKINMPNMHMMFTGNPGTGKTTVAKMIADYLYNIGALKTNHLVTCDSNDLISKYHGEAGNNADAIIKKAMGGILFIDEAYFLAQSKSEAVKAEVVTKLITAMEEHKGEFIVIFAGYEREMQEFKAMNSGIASRIGYTFHFEDYTPEELTKMFVMKMEKQGFKLSSSVAKYVEKVVTYFSSLENFGNGRFVDSIIDQTIMNRSMREYTPNKKNNFMSITKEDVPTIEQMISRSPEGRFLYNPSERKEEAVLRTTIHELGHAICAYARGQGYGVKDISIMEMADSYGRVTFKREHRTLTQDACLSDIIIDLGGRNAERLILGNNSAGCSQDYEMAKKMAKAMVKDFAMGIIGQTTAMDFLREGDIEATNILTEYKDALITLKDKLLVEKKISGEEFVKLMDAEREKLKK